MDSFSSDSDIIDDNGCESMFQASYWDIDYVQTIQQDNGYENEEEVEEMEESTPHSKVVTRKQYSTVDESGENSIEDFYKQENEEEDDEYSSSDVSSDLNEKQTPITTEEEKIIKKMQQLGLKTDIDLFYDSTIDERAENWSNTTHYTSVMQEEGKRKRPKTDAVLCCPSCFTTICYECKLVKKGMLSSINRSYEKQGSHVFITTNVFNCYCVGSEYVKGKANQGEQEKAIPIGNPVVCSVCGNEVGFKQQDEYVLMNMIEEDGECNWIVC